MKKTIYENAKTLAYAILLALLFRTLFFQPFYIPSGSMKDTLLIGDFLFVNKMSYGYSRHSCPWSLCPIPGRIFASEPERGDVIVFKHPVSKVDYIKRLVGLPGDRIQVIDGTLHINGEAALQEPAGEFLETFERQGGGGRFPQCTNRPSREGQECKKTRYFEALPGARAHSILDVRPGYGDNTGALVVPEGEYFFMGDNRDNSQDSRFPQSAGGVGTVPFENLVGRADRVVFSSAGRSLWYIWTWRLDRFFTSIQ